MNNIFFVVVRKSEKVPEEEGDSHGEEHQEDAGGVDQERLGVLGRVLEDWGSEVEGGVRVLGHLLVGPGGHMVDILWLPSYWTRLLLLLSVY